MADDIKPVDDPVKQLTPIAWYDANTMRALLLASVGLLASIAGLFGINEELFSVKAAHLVDQLANFVTLGGVAWAVYARTRHPTPPVTTSRAAAAVQTEAMKVAGTLPPDQPL